jgi:hypothetical protein
MASKKTKVIAVLSIIIVSVVATVLGVLFIPEKEVSQHEKSETSDILILTNFATKKESALYISMGLDTRVNIDIFGISDDKAGAIQAYNISNYDVIVVDCYLPENETDCQWLFDEITNPSNRPASRGDIGVLFFGGNYTGLSVFESILPAYFITDRDIVNATMAESLTGSIGFSDIVFDQYLEEVYNETQEFTIMGDQIQVQVAAEESDLAESNQLVFSTNVAWQSCPLLRYRVSTYARKPSARTIVEVPNTKEPLMVLGKMSDLSSSISSNGSVIFVSPGVGILNLTDSEGSELKEMNVPFSLWPYFNYLMYLSIFFLDSDFVNSELESYALWPWSPIPHEREANMWMTFVGFLWVFNFALFFALGKKKKAKDLEEKSGEKAYDGKESGSGDTDKKNIN